MNGQMAMLMDMDLAQFLANEIAKTSIRKVAKKIGLSKTAVDNIAQRRVKGTSEHHTLELIAKAFELPVWKVQLMAGMNADINEVGGIPVTPEQLAQVNEMIASTTPEEYQQVLDEVKTEMIADSGFVAELRAFIRGRRGGGPKRKKRRS